MTDTAPASSHGPADHTADPGEPDLEPLLRNLNASQRAAVTSTASPLRILAGAGSGKTRVLTHRIAYAGLTGAADPQRVLAVTFTRKAARELHDRLGRLGLRGTVQAGTFHSIAYAQLRQRWEEKGIRPPELLDRKVGFVARLCPKGAPTLPLDVVSEIEWASARLVTPEDYVTAAAQALRRPPIASAAVAEVYQRYIEAKTARRLVDFDDLLALAARDLAGDPVRAAARRWRFRHLYVDEFQDVNPLQHRLLSAWLGPESSLCVVGDPNQAIYAWNGADARYLVDFDRYFPGGDTIELAHNYRSTPEVLAAANAVLTSGSFTHLRLRANRPPGAAPTVTRFDDDRSEAQAIARRARDTHAPGTRWADQAVLVRTNAQTAAIAEALGAAGIPHRLRGGASLLDQAEVKQALRGLRHATSVSAFLVDTEREASSGEVGLTEERRANLAELVRLGREYLALDPAGSPAGFTAWLRSTLRDDDSGSGDVVDVLTFHAAKGLEWGTVHLAGLEKGFVPIHHTEDDPESLDEERRLLYVALTRARDALHCSWAAQRTFGTRTVRRSPSPWIDVLQRSADPLGSRVVPREEGARRARAARSALASRSSVDPADAELFEALRAWRLAKAHANDVPAFVVFSDATLREVASRRPTTPGELRGISGIGAVKADRFGKELIEIVASVAR